MSRRLTIFRVSAVAVTASVAVLAATGAVLAKDKAEINFDHVSCRGVPNEIRVVVNNVDDSVGLIIADLYKDDEEGFLRKAGRVQQVRFAARAPITTFCMQAPNDTPHAIAVYHDENANKTFDKKAFGLPAEPYGVSNNPAMRFGPPSVTEALFDVAINDANVEIRLKD